MTISLDGLIEGLRSGCSVESNDGLLVLTASPVQLRAMVAHSTVVVPLSQLTLTKPNPHRAGTFLWAKLEYERGNVVARSDSPPYIPGTQLWGDRLFRGEDVDASDWRVE